MAHGGDVAIARLVVRNASFRRHDRRQRAAPRRCQYQHWAPYAQVNVGVAREFLLPDDPKPMTFASMSSISSTRSISSETAAVSVYSPPQFGPRRGYFAGTSKNSDAWTEATCGRRQNVDMGGSFPRWIGGATMSTIASERRMRRFGGPVQRAQPISGEVKRGAVSALSAVAPSSLSAALVWAQQNPQSSPEAPAAAPAPVSPASPSYASPSPKVSHWQQALVARLDRFKCYPAQAHGAEGVASLAFTIDPNGNVLSSQIATSSGSRSRCRGAGSGQTRRAISAPARRNH